MMREIEESGMKFLVDESKLFYIEKSSLYRRLNGKSVSSVEFVELLPKGRIVFVEAKPDAPKDASEFSSKIRKKVSHSLQMCFSMLHEIVDDSPEEMPIAMREALQNQPRFRTIVVVKDLAVEHCVILQYYLNIKFEALCHIWKMDILVFNEERARKRKMIA